MPDQQSLSESDLSLIRSIVTEAVSSYFAGVGEAEQTIRARLRRFERIGLPIGLEPQTVQVIRSGRRLIGDTTHLCHVA